MSRNGKILYGNLSPSVNKDGLLFEIDSTFPPVGDEVQNIIYVQPLTLNNDGITTDMKVDGSTTIQEFYIESENDYDIIINSVSFFIGAETTVVDLFEFGATNGTLPNGCQLIYESSKYGEIIIGDNLNSNFELLRMCNMNPEFGLTSNEAFQVVQTFSNNDRGYFFILKFSNYGYESEYRGGLRLKKNEKERLVFKIRDNLNFIVSELSSLNGTTYGYKTVTN